MHIFSAKNIRILYIESTKTVSEMTLNDALNSRALNSGLKRWSKCGAVRTGCTFVLTEINVKDSLLETKNILRIRKWKSRFY